MQVVIEPKTVQLDSTSNIYSLKLTDHPDIPKGYNISKTFFDFPDNLLEIRLFIGGQLVAKFDKTKYNNLETFPIYMSLLPYDIVVLDFVYDRTWLYENETVEDQDEYKYVETFGPETTVYNEEENSYYTGKTVIRNREPTGNKVRTITKPVSLGVPKIIFVVEKHNINNNIDTVSSNKVDIMTNDEYIDVPVIQKLKLSTMSEEDKNTIWKQENIRLMGMMYILKTIVDINKDVVD
jgi:hypothetical protein